MGKIVTLDNLEHFYGKLRDFIASEHELSESVINQSISLKQDKLVSGTNIKTINGTSILGSGDIISNAYQLVNHGTSDMIFTLTPNTLHIWDNVSALLLTMGDEIDGVANEYIFQFISGSKPTTLILPDSVTFNSDFTIEENKMYQISILNKLGTVMSWDINKNISDDSTDYRSEYFTIEALEDGLTVRLNTNAAEVEALNDGLTAQSSTNECEYRIDNGDWNTLSADSDTPSINKGQTLSFKGNLTPIPNPEGGGIGTFTISKKCNLKGNIMSLLYGDDFIGQNDLTGKDFAFTGLFSGCSNIVEAHNLILPATTLAMGCYFNTFVGCESLTTVPELPATTLAEGCYCNMFGFCTSLITAPELPATTLAVGCYSSMFAGCTSLTIAPELPATTLTTQCYSFMFNGCSNLNYIKMLAIDINADYCLDSWVSGVASSGTFVKHPYMTSLSTGSSGIPEGWTVVDKEGVSVPPPPTGLPS